MLKSEDISIVPDAVHPVHMTVVPVTGTGKSLSISKSSKVRTIFFRDYAVVTSITWPVRPTPSRGPSSPGQ